MIISISCQKNEFKPSRETGKLHVSIGLRVNVNEVGRGLKSMPRIEDFKVTIYSADGTLVMAFDSVSAMPDTIELETGNYYVAAHSDNDLPAAFENPYYFGASEVFTIGSNSRQSVLVNCELANTIVTILYSGNVTSSFIDYTTTVSSQLGSLVFSRDETRMGYFRTLPLEIMVELSYLLPDGSYASKVLSGQIPEPLPNRHYQVLVDATVNGGMANFSIIMDSSEAVVEVIELTDHSGNPHSSGIGYGELLITEIMYNPSVLTDTEGEWFEIYNNSDQTINLQNLVLVRDDLNRHIITDSIELSAAGYFVFKRTEMATDATNSYVFGSGILLPNTGAVLGIYNEGTEIEPGALIFSVNYGGDHFPDSPGASISLNPDMVTPADAILGTSWCIATSVYNTGDFGTPGAVNDPCQ
ncbi:MAG: hypothetical protein AMS23_04735 [Bacteroides sp. SM1_62]|nr:MAG: hypothetical protein AMS26_06230 [Bacteroides sp. SM23_62]KPL25705.1 MAG: hypothetical protein AMS23_04735 [Bacteroides sp. SM1_62]